MINSFNQSNASRNEHGYAYANSIYRLIKSPVLEPVDISVACFGMTLRCAYPS